MCLNYVTLNAPVRTLFPRLLPGLGAAARLCAGPTGVGGLLSQPRFDGVQGKVSFVAVSWKGVILLQHYSPIFPCKGPQPGCLGWRVQDLLEGASGLRQTVPRHRPGLGKQGMSMSALHAVFSFSS